MLKTKWLFLFLCIGGILKADEIYVLTGRGDVFRSDDFGINFSLVSNTGYQNDIDMYFNNDTLGFLLTEKGIIMKTTDTGRTWTAVSSLPVSDARSITASGNKYYVLTRSGDLYRGDSANNMTPFASIGANDMVDIVGLGSELYALTSSGDVYRSNDMGSTWTLRGNTGSLDMKSLVMIPDTLYAINSTGDLYRSIDSARTWVAISTVSDVGVVDMTNDVSHNLYVVLDAGDVAKSSTGKSWGFSGTASQVGVTAIATPTQPPLSADEDRGIKLPFRVYPNFTSDFFMLEADSFLLNKKVRLLDLNGRIIERRILDNSRITFDMRKYKDGSYIIDIDGYNRKLIKH